MLAFDAWSDLSGKEALMPSIQANSSAVRGLLAIPLDVRSSELGPRRFTPVSDRALTHAWSIGITRVAQYPRSSRSETIVSGTQGHPDEDCPPEVYIG